MTEISTHQPELAESPQGFNPSLIGSDDYAEIVSQARADILSGVSTPESRQQKLQAIADKLPEALTTLGGSSELDRSVVDPQQDITER